MQAKFVLVKLCNSSFIRSRGSEILKGNSISYDVDYRATIFRILPGLKNLDVITMKRQSNEIELIPKLTDHKVEG